MTRRTWFQWHSWIGLTAGLLLFVVCWSGTVAVFSHELDRMLDRRLAAPVAETVQWQRIHQQASARFPDWTVTQVSAPAVPGAAAESWAEDDQGVLRRIYSDPATGEVIGATSYFNIQRFFRSFHMSLFIGELPLFGIPLGYFIVGLLSFPLLASGVTSLIFYKRFWRGFFKLQRHRGLKVFWSDLHKLTGLWSFWFLLVIALTGIWYLAEWKTPAGSYAPEPPGAVAGTQPLPIDRLVAIGQRAYPELRIKVVATYSLGDGLLELQGQDGSALVRDRAANVWVNSFTGDVVGVRRPAAMSLYDRWIHTADPLHFGDFGGPISKAIWFLFGLGLSGLCLTGAYLQVKRQRRHHQDLYRGPMLAAYAVSLAVLLTAALYGYRELLTYGPGGTQLPSVTNAQLAFISLWCAFTASVLSLWAWKLR